MQAAPRALEGRIAVVTGGSRGLGLGIARAFSRAGATPVLAARTEKDLLAAAESIRAGGGACAFVPGDLGDPAACRHLAHYVAGQFGRLDVLVNNAGVLGPMVPLADYPEAEWDAVIRANLSAVFYATKALLPLLARGRAPSIVNVTSSVGRKGRALWGAYSVSKFGVEGFTQTLAEELRDRGIRVNAVNPGGTRTGMRAEAYPEEDPATLPSPEAVAPIFVHLASEASRSVTGQSLNAREWLAAHGG